MTTALESQDTVIAKRRARGETKVADTVVAKIAAAAARKVDGVVGLGGGGASGAMGSMVERLRGQEHSTSGVDIEVGTLEAAVDLTVRLRYPTNIVGCGDAVRRQVAEDIQTMTGLDVVEVNIAVAELVLPDPDGDDDGPRVR